MQTLLKYICKWMLVVAGLFLGAAYAMAGNGNGDGGIVAKVILDGSQHQISTDSMRTVLDSTFFDPANASLIGTGYSVQNQVTVMINEAAQVYLHDAFTVTIQLHITYSYNSSGDTTSLDRDFTVHYDSAHPYNCRSSFVFSGAHKVSVKVVSVTSNVSWDATAALMVVNQLVAKPDFSLACTQTVTGITVPTAVLDSADELPVSWSAVKTADQYDLEWAYVDDSALATYKTSGVLDRGRIFRNNATRISTTATGYNIPLIYDDNGTLFIRVRPTQVNVSGAVTIGTWSSDPSATGMGQFHYSGHERPLNWQSNISFAEEGKRKVVVQYYDGGLRNRQTVTKDNTTNKTIIAESYYDYQGRPVIQVMPTPTLHTAIQYVAGFNVGLNNAEYTKDHYDLLTDGQAICSIRADSMSNASGASQYYSPSNPLKDDGMNAYIPNAKDYPFTETEYTRDNTGRISRQGGVGADHQLGTGHEVKYYYGRPDQQELDAMFGTEVGDYTHYFKNMVRDANGQYSISYVDMHGRTIATALAGTGSGTPNLATLPSNQETILTENLADPNTPFIQDLSMISQKELIVTKPGNYDFSYNLTPYVLKDTNCAQQTVCYTCLYDLRITVKDQCDGIPYDTIVHNFKIDSIQLACNPQNVGFDFSLALQEGSYTVTKILTVSQEGYAYYRDSVYLPNNTCVSLQDYINQQRTIVVAANSDCAPTCSSCRANLGTWQQYQQNFMTQAGIAPADSASFRTDALTAYNNAVSACDALCNVNQSDGNDIRSAMIQDMTPPYGQYADTSRGVYKDLYSIFYTPSADNTTQIPVYKLDAITYLDDNGHPDSVYNDATGTMVEPGSLSISQFVQKFRTSWAEALLPYHPEYCKLLALNKHSASNAWDRQMEAVEDYQTAVSQGYLNPTGNSTFPYTIVTANIDPLSQESTAFKNALETQLNKSFSKSTLPDLSMWSYACVLARCDSGDATCVTTYSQAAHVFNTAEMCEGDLNMAWKNFRQLYLNAKQTIVNNAVANPTDCTPLNKWLNNRVPSSVKLYNANHQPQFDNDVSSTMVTNGLGAISQGNSTQAISNVQDSLNSFYDQNAAAYATQWTTSLSSCKYNQSDLKTILLPRLTALCRIACDQDHPFGASTLPTGVTYKPAGTSYSFTSFSDILNAYNTEKGITNVLGCNAEMITNPQPYDTHQALVTESVYSQPSDCECAVIQKYYTNYQLFGSDTTFAGYLWRTQKISMGDSDLTQLLSMCNGTTTAATCRYLPKAIVLPPALQCNTGSSSCVACTVIDTLYQRYQQLYPDNLPSDSLNEEDSVQMQKNTLFQNYMNNRLGFTKQAWEYLAFMDTCARVTHNGVEINISGTALCADNTKSISGNDSYTYYNGPTLCGSTDPIYPTTTAKQITTCSDSTFFIVSSSTELFHTYRDSLTGNFEQLYKQRCLEAYKSETFTVTHATSEYHYTLYYYDQAGNLLKTVPPAAAIPNFDATWLSQVATARTAHQALTPSYGLVTSYRYNTLNQVVAQVSPDGGLSHFWYDRLGRLSTSQNALQKQHSQYSYTQYDTIGRITEVGQITSYTAMTDLISRKQTSWKTWLTASYSNVEQVTQTSYDEAYADGALDPILQARNLRNRVARTALYDNATDLTATVPTPATATYYSYDILGNVDTLVHDYRNGVMTGDNQFKKLVYQYDLVSGKVNHVAYQPNQADAFYHKYIYDAENRITNVLSSTDSINWDNDAWYNYYAHGPLATTILGEQQVQGINYAYTLQGWLKTVNPTATTIGAAASGVALPAYSYALNYYNNDFQGIAATSPTQAVPGLLGDSSRQLFNGNITSMAVNIDKLNSPMLYNYKYDQLNRLVNMDAYQSNAAWSALTLASNFGERISYDANGNIQTYLRNGNTATGNPLGMDSLGYYYKPGTNKLDHILDAVASTNYTEDIDNQASGNYTYDTIGNLIADNAAGISNITWTVYGKISGITKTDGTTIAYTYDAGGNRISKGVTTSGNTITTWYVRDAQGNLMSAYTAGDASVNSNDLTQTELDLYGSSRLGIWKRSVDVVNVAPVDTTLLPLLGTAYGLGFYRGSKLFEMSNHLRNVLSTVSDKEYGINSEGSTVGHYVAEVVGANDYYLFGMGMSYNVEGYRYGFNGKENDNEVSGIGNHLDFKFRGYTRRQLYIGWSSKLFKYQAARYMQPIY